MTVGGVLFHDERKHAFPLRAYFTYLGLYEQMLSEIYASTA